MRYPSFSESEKQDCFQAAFVILLLDYFHSALVIA